MNVSDRDRSILKHIVEKLGREFRDEGTASFLCPCVVFSGVRSPGCRLLNPEIATQGLGLLLNMLSQRLGLRIRMEKSSSRTVKCRYLWHDLQCF